MSNTNGLAPNEFPCDPSAAGLARPEELFAPSAVARSAATGDLMRMAFLFCGLAIALVALVDFIWTTLSVKGAGPLTSFCARQLWSASAAISKVANHRWPLLLAGPVILLSALLVWFILLWLAWTLIFSATSGALVTASDNMPAAIWSRIYFVGFTLTTLGIGDVRPDGAVWQVLTVVTGLSGLTIVTMTITYLLGVLSAVVSLRTCSVHISALGTSSCELVQTGWDGTSFAPLGDHIMALTTTLHQLTQYMLAYPILTYFAAERVAAIAPSVVVLDESLTILQQGVAPSVRLADGRTRPLRRALDGMIDGLSPAPSLQDGCGDGVSAGNTRAAIEGPPAPCLAALRRAGIPTVDHATFHQALAGRAAHRCRLDEALRYHGWDWRAVTA